MTDTEIIKALEDLLKNFEGRVVDFMAISSAIDLINRQQEMIDGLIAGQETLQKALAEKNAEIEELEAEYEKVYEQAEADILGNLPQGGTSCHWCIDKHKNYAIKELAKDFEEEFFVGGVTYSITKEEFHEFIKRNGG